jgi:hypothetical protein
MRAVSGICLLKDESKRDPLPQGFDFLGKHSAEVAVFNLAQQFVDQRHPRLPGQQARYTPVSLPDDRVRVKGTGCPGLRTPGRAAHQARKDLEGI